MDSNRLCQWCGKEYAPIREKQTCCSRKCSFHANQAFTLAARRHYRAYLKSQSLQRGSTQLLEQAPTLESTTAAKAIPIGWDHGLMRNWHGKVQPKQEKVGAVIVEKRIKR